MAIEIIVLLLLILVPVLFTLKGLCKFIVALLLNDTRLLFEGVEVLVLFVGLRELRMVRNVLEVKIALLFCHRGRIWDSEYGLLGQCWGTVLVEK